QVVAFRAGSATPLPDLTLTKTHIGNFVQGQAAATYTLTATNRGTAATAGSVTVVDTLPAGLTATSFIGTGWACTMSPLGCNRGDALATGASYPAIVVTVNVASSAGSPLVNTATVSGGGDASSGNNTANDSTIVSPPAAPDLVLSKTHTGSFTQ